MTGRRLLTGIVAATALLAAGCGSAPARPSSPGPVQAAGSSGPRLDTTVSSTSGTSWAVVQMGGSAASFDNFWELFVRPAGAARWQLVTPAGVASNGGLVMTATGATSLVAGFRPSQDLKFSPLATTASAGAQWAQTALLSAGLADAPGALAGGPGGRLLALTSTGDVETSTSLGATWQPLTTQRSLTGTAAGRDCGVTALTAAAWTPAGSPLVGARCDRAGVAGIFTSAAGAWRLAGPTLPAAFSRSSVDVLGLATTGAKTTAILAASTSGKAAGTSVLAAWSTDGGAHWRLSPVLAADPASRPSVSIWADGSAGLILSAASPRSGTVIGWQAASWQPLPSLPARTATLAPGPTGQLQALAASGATMTAWQLAPGALHWAPTQTIRVPIPYGSSG